jgi:UDP-3-O-acyl-N-acetylglucosamine deacetylase
MVGDGTGVSEHSRLITTIDHLISAIKALGITMGQWEVWVGEFYNCI